MSATYLGGYNWWNSNSTHAPLLLASLDNSGFTIDRSTSTSGFTTYNALFSGSNYIVMDLNPSGPPYNWVRYNMYIIRVGNTTATMSTGVDYNARYVDTQVVTIHTTSDPNSPIIDSSNITSILLPSGTPITTTINSVLSSSNLVITNDNNVSNLSKTGLSITDGSNNNIVTQNSVSLNNGFLLTNLIEKDKITITDNTNSTQSIYSNNGITLRDNTASQAMLLNYSRILIGNDITQQQVSFNNQYFAFNNQSINKVFIRALDSPYLTLDDGTHNAQLTTTDLLFNSVGIKSSITQNTLDISQNKLDISNNTSNITTLQQNAIQAPLTQLCSPAVYGTSPSLPPQRMFTSTSASNIINIGYNGWYFRNFTAGVNMGWNAGFASSTSIVSDLLQLSFSFITPITTTSPQITVYTSPATGGNFYNSRRSYVNSGTPTINTPYIYYINFNGYTGVPFKSGHTAVSLTNTQVSNVGAFAGTETLYFWSVGTNSGASANTVELVVSNMTFKMNSNSNGIITQPYIFNNSDVITTPQFSNQEAGTRTITPYDYATQILCTGNVTISGANLRAQDAQFYITCVNAKQPNGPINITFVGSGGNTTIQLDVSGQLVLIWTGTYWIL